ncbi:uncharacterized protein LOC107217967 [Neodiprion lecontei]|uniref:Uncharacterized protein LOC107217967 n=1 Tax=Neodiprion lecontei TaxID=441921 RepID=A0A6J0BAC0_NEOLC|nr:uncharacterized protein LOC107217967 [Neodiprion lecontei]
MTAPAMGMVHLSQAGCGVQLARILFLVLALASLLFLIPDGVGAFRIRDGGGSASIEQTRTSCNPLFGKCAQHKTSGLSATTSSSPIIGLRRRFEGATAFSSRPTKSQPLVEESGEVRDNDRAHAGASSYVKSKFEKVASVKVPDVVRAQLRNSAVTKAAASGFARSSIQSKSYSRNSYEDDDGTIETEENEDDNDDSEDYDEENDDDDEDRDDTDGEEENDGEDGNEDEDEDVENYSKDEEGSQTESEEEIKDDEATKSSENEDDDEDADYGRIKVEDEQVLDSNNEDVESTESVEDKHIRIKHEAKIAKQDMPSDKMSIKVTPVHHMWSTENSTRQSIEDIEKLITADSTGQSNEDMEAATKTTRHDDGASDQAGVVDLVEENGDKFVAQETEFDGTTLDASKISVSKYSTSENDDDGDQSEVKKDDTGKVEDVVVPPPRKLERVRLADKSKSMEVVLGRSIEDSFEKAAPQKVTKTEPRQVQKVSSDAEKIEVLKPASTGEQKSESLLVVKPSENISLPLASQKTNGTVKKGKNKAGPRQPTKEAKPPPQPLAKQSEKSKVKVPERESDQKSTKSNAKPKKRMEASITLSELNDLLLTTPSFTPNFTAIENPVCQQHGKIFLRQLRGYKLWALQMLDSSAKVPSGLLRGNINQLGDFDQCLGVKAYVKVDEKTVKVQGKYCLATIDLQATRHDTKIPVNFMQSRAFLRASMNGPSHFIPRFTTANWALCVPAACSPADVQSVIKDALSAYNESMGLRFSIGVDPDSCYVKQKAQPYSKETVAILYFYAMTVCLVLVATLRDFFLTFDRPGSYSERIIMAFSLRRTTTLLLQDSQSRNDIRCIHGIRTLATILLYVAHKLIPMSRIPFANRISLTEVANNPISSILRVSLVYTDSFLLLSGVLTAYNMAKEYNKRGEIRWFCRFVTRFIRLTPVLLAVVFWYAFVMEHVGSGPQWNSVVKSNADLCKKNAWTNLLYIQNFLPFEEMCATHTHQLALDMQLSLIAPMLVFFLYNKPVIGILVILFLLQVSATLRYLATTNNYLSLVIFHGMTLKHLYKTANLMYALPLHRATPYLFGTALGTLMHYTGKQVRIHKVLVIIGWVVAAALGFWSLFSPWRSARRDYTYDVEEATYYAVVLPVFWSISLSWVIFASFTQNGGVLNRFLSHHWLVVLSRISYSVYLTQFAVFFYNVGITRYTAEFQLHRSIDLYEAAAVISVSVTLTLLLDLPMQEVKNVIMEFTDGLTVDKVNSVDKVDEKTTETKNHILVKQVEKDSALADEEVESTGWDWQKDIVSSRNIEDEYLDGEETLDVQTFKNDHPRRKSFIRRNAEEEEEIPTWDWIQTPVRKIPRRSNDEDKEVRRERRSLSRQEILANDYVDEPKTLKRSSVQQPRDEDVCRRDGRSQPRAWESRKTMVQDLEESSRNFKQRDDSFLRAGDGRKSDLKDHEVLSRESTKGERPSSKDTDGVSASMWRPIEQPSWEYVNRERSASQSARDGKRTVTKGLDGQSSALRSSTGSLPRASDLQRKVLSDTEEPTYWKKKQLPAKVLPLEEPRVSDEENWEYELRLRRQKIGKILPSDETGTASEEEDWSILRRRSSAEGKMALLNDSSEIKSFGAWSISKVPNTTSDAYSHEPSESDEENAYDVTRNDYRETRPPFRERYDTQSEDETSWNPSRQQSRPAVSPTTFVDEEKDPSSYDFMLKKVSKRTSLQNLDRISQEELEAEEDTGWDFVKEENADMSDSQTTSTGLFKRASIIRSQASEEDPEYVLPERPKLVEQEQEHPFKKAWQMQKSRSEEDGPVGFLVKDKDTRPRSGGSEGRKDAPQQDEIKRARPSAGGQNEDLSYFGGDEAESTSVSYPASNSGDSASLDWIEDEERSTVSGLEETELESTESAEKDAEFLTGKKEQMRYSEEANWEWNQEET